MEGRAGRADQALAFLLGEDLWQAMALFRIRSVVDTPSPPECLAVKNNLKAARQTATLAGDSFRL